MTSLRWRAAAAVLVGIASWPAHAANADANPRQTLAATVAVPAVRAELLRLCADGDCTTVGSAPSTARQLRLVLQHDSSARDSIPDVVAVAGRPLPPGAAGCAGHLGVAVAVGRTGGAGAVVSLAVVVDGVSVTTRTWSATDKQRPTSVSVCLPAA